MPLSIPSIHSPIFRCYRKPVVVLRQLLAILTLLAVSACQDNPAPPVPDIPTAAATTPLRLGIGSMITPKEGYVFYQQLGRYIEQRLQRPVQLVDRGTYDAFNKLLQESALDLAFICGGPYVEGKDAFDLQLLVKPETISGETVYYSLILVPAGSPATTLEDLRGKSFAFTDPKSNTGYIVPSAMLARANETPKRFFGEINFTYAHDRSIRAVAEGVVDAAAIDSLIYDYLAQVEPKLTSRVRILLRSPAYGIPPVVVRPDLPPEIREKLRTLLLDMDNNAEGQKILNSMLLRRFVPATDADYDTIRRDRNLVRQFENR